MSGASCAKVYVSDISKAVSLGLADRFCQEVWGLNIIVKSQH